MKIQLDVLYVTLIAALGLDLGCAVSPSTSEAGESDDSGDGDGDSGSSSGDGDGDGEPPPAPFECEGETPVLQAGTDQPSGFVMCGNGFIHRKEKIDAIDPQGLDDPNCAMNDFGPCKTAADCTGDYARCVNLGGDSGCGCDNGCVSDADCSPSEVCAPAGVAGSYSTCIPGACKIDDECGDGLCGLSLFQHCCGPTYQTVCAEQDELCHVNSDCPDAPCDWVSGDAYPFHCAVEAWPSPSDGVWECLGYGPCGCVCGRPFFVDGHARVAPAFEREDWCRTLDHGPRPLDAALRVRLAEHWAVIARFEHASIASFARVSLQLMQLGAPPSLLRDTSRALRDEIEHARITFGLASAYAGAPIGPGSLAVADTLVETSDLYDIVDGLIAEACVGETLAAIEAREAACWAEDPAVKAALERIAADEWDHARLGWRTLGWVLTRADAALREFAVARLQAAIAASWSNALEPMAPGDAELRRHGVLDPALRGEVRRAGLTKVVQPCVVALARRESNLQRVGA
jgi:hypothetical protein